MKDRFYIGVIGASRCSTEISALAEEVGYEIAKQGAVLICGGLGGVMEAACRGAKKGGGLTIGIIPGKRRRDANQYVDIPIVTGLSEARNLVIIHSSDGLIAISGGFGTLSEIGFALKMGKPVIGLGTWDIGEPLIQAETPKAAVDKIFELIQTH